MRHLFLTSDHLITLRATSSVKIFSTNLSWISFIFHSYWSLNYSYIALKVGYFYLKYQTFSLEMIINDQRKTLKVLWAFLLYISIFGNILFQFLFQDYRMKTSKQIIQFPKFYCFPSPQTWDWWLAGSEETSLELYICIGLGILTMAAVTLPLSPEPEYLEHVVQWRSRSRSWINEEYCSAKANFSFCVLCTVYCVTNSFVGERKF